MNMDCDGRWSISSLHNLVKVVDGENIIRFERAGKSAEHLVGVRGMGVSDRQEA